MALSEWLATPKLWQLPVSRCWRPLTWVNLIREEATATHLCSKSSTHSMELKTKVMVWLYPGVMEDHGERRPTEGSQSSSEAPCSLKGSQHFGPNVLSKYWHEFSLPDAFEQKAVWIENSDPSKKPLPKALANFCGKVTSVQATGRHEIISHSTTLSSLGQLSILPAVDYYSHTFPTVAACFPNLFIYFSFGMAYFNLYVTHLLKSTWKQTTVCVFLVISEYWQMPAHVTVCLSERAQLDWCFNRYPNSLLN